MTASPERVALQRLTSRDVPVAVGVLEDDFGRRPRPLAEAANAVLLDALDRGLAGRFVAWPSRDEPRALLYLGASGLIVPAGDPAAGDAFADLTDRNGWRVLVGDLPLGRAIVEAGPRLKFWRRPTAREQRFMVAEERSAVPVPDGFRPAEPRDVDVLTELACRLHVEDRMGPPISRAARASVRARMSDAVLRGDSFVVEREGAAVAKVDVSLRSRRRGAQIAGVYVDAAWRGQGLASGTVAAVGDVLRAEGAPWVTLHVRTGNDPAIAAYRRAGFVDRGPWLLAVR